MAQNDMAASPLEPNALDALIEMIGLDEPDFLIELIDTFLTDSSNLVDTLPVDWHNGDSETVTRTAHSLKSTSATFQAMRLSKLAAELEAEMRGEDVGINILDHINQIVAEHSLVKAALMDEKTKLSARL